MASKRQNVVRTIRYVGNRADARMLRRLGNMPIRFAPRQKQGTMLFGLLPHQLPRERTLVTNILFIDVDGTLTTLVDGDQYIPPSALAGLIEARKRGALAYLCTGRSLAEAGTLGELPVDGIIGAGGGFVISEGELVMHQIFSAEQLAQVEDAFAKLEVDYYFETNQGLYFSPTFLAQLGELWSLSPESPFMEIVHPLAEADRSEVNKISFHSARGARYEDIEAALGADFHLVMASWGEASTFSGEVMLPGVDKAMAIERLLDHLQLGEVRTFGFGDSMNDAEMLQACDEAIVMGNARHGVERYATFVTRDLLDDGFAHALKHFGLIG